MNSSDCGGISAGSLIVIAAVGIGLALVLVPMLPDNRPMRMEKNFAEDSVCHRRLMAAAKRVDLACQGSDLAVLMSLLSDRYREKLSAGLTGDQDLDSLLLAQSDGMVGNFSEEEYVYGGSGSDRACIIYRSERPDPVLRAFVFRWTGRYFQLDGRATQPKQSWTQPDAEAQAASWAASLLGGR